MGEEGNLNINTFATSIAELSEWKAREQEEATKQITAELNNVSGKFESQTQSIIAGAVESVKKRLGWWKTALWLVVNWPLTVTVIFSAIATGVSVLIGNWHWMWTIFVPTFLKLIEICCASNFVGRSLAKRLLPKIDVRMSKRILRGLREAERPYQDTIIQKVKEQTKLWIKCKEMSRS